MLITQHRRHLSAARVPQLAPLTRSTTSRRRQPLCCTSVILQHTGVFAWPQVSRARGNYPDNTQHTDTQSTSTRTGTSRPLYVGGAGGAGGIGGSAAGGGGGSTPPPASGGGGGGGMRLSRRRRGAGGDGRCESPAPAPAPMPPAPAAGTGAGLLAPARSTGVTPWIWSSHTCRNKEAARKMHEDARCSAQVVSTVPSS